MQVYMLSCHVYVGVVVSVLHDEGLLKAGLWPSNTSLKIYESRPTKQLQQCIISLTQIVSSTSADGKNKYGFSAKLLWRPNNRCCQVCQKRLLIAPVIQIMQPTVPSGHDRRKSADKANWTSGTYMYRSALSWYCSDFWRRLAARWITWKTRHAIP